MGKFQRKYNHVAYGKPKEIKKSGTLINVGSRIGTKIVQIVYIRPSAWGYKVGQGKKK